MRIFDLTRSFPLEERCSSTDQIRMSSRSVCLNIAEAWRKRRSKAAFISKLNDSEGEAAETQVSLETAWRSGYIEGETFTKLDEAYEKALGQLVKMPDHPEKWAIGSQQQRGIHPPIRPLALSPIHVSTHGHSSQI